jgi:CBS domain-containing protein
LLGLGDANQQLHLKKEGIFPLVHGVRSLALANRLVETNTIERISALVAKGKMTAQMGADLTDSLYFFMSLKLKAGLAEMDTDKPVTGSVDVGKLTSLDRDLLKDALAVVKRFRVGLRQQFHLDSI